MLFVYVDFTDDGRPFYVGQGTASRVRRIQRNVYHDRVAVKHGYRREVVLETPGRFEALNRELRLIAELHTFIGDPCWNRIGTNLTSGGDGGDPDMARAAAIVMWNNPRSRERITRGIRRSWLGNRKRQLYISRAIRRYRARPEVKLAMRSLMLKRWQDPAYAAERAKTMSSLWQNVDTRAKIIAGIRRAKSTPQAKVKLANRNKRVWEAMTADQRCFVLARLRAGRRAKLALKRAEKALEPPVVRSAVKDRSASAKNSWSDPEIRLARVEGMKRVWIERRAKFAASNI